LQFLLLRAILRIFRFIGLVFTAVANARPEEGQQYRQQEHTVHGTNEDYKEDHLEENQEDIGTGQ